MGMPAEVATHIELRKNRDGQNRAYIAGTRIRVQDIYAYAEIQGLSSDEIVEQLPHLTLGQVHAALSYFFDHREQILDEIRQDDEFAKLLRTQTGPGPLEQRLSTDAHGDTVSS
jgi:uncharacterized protein (DUF433 family)